MKPNPFTATTNEIDRALEAMRLITPLSENGIAQRSYQLFHVIMQARAHPQEKKWEASRLTMRGAYKWDRFLPWVGDPQEILTFLDHHFDLATYASGPSTIKALGRFDSTKPSFIRGICHVYQDDKPLQLRKAALFFLPLIGERWFNTPHLMMRPDQMEKLY